MTTHNYSNLSLYQAIEHIATYKDKNTKEKFLLYCKDGFFDVLLTVDDNKEFCYNAIELYNMVLVGWMRRFSDGTSQDGIEIMKRSEYEEKLNNLDRTYTMFDDMLEGW